MNCIVIFSLHKHFHFIFQLFFNFNIFFPVQDIHLSRNEKERDLKWLNFKKKYKSQYYLRIYQYVRDNWYLSRFNKWMIYHTPPGWANTNSNIESFNATIKRDFFQEED